MVATRHGTNTDPPELPQKELGPDVVDPFFNDQISICPRRQFPALRRC